MICKDCAYEADIQSAGGKLLPAGQTRSGHKFCKGCDCHHFPVGTRQIARGDVSRAG